MQHNNNVKIQGKFAIVMSLNMRLAQINEHNGYDWNGILLYSLQILFLKFMQNSMHYANSVKSTLNILGIR